MREIKFRGKSIIISQWFVGDVVRWKNWIEDKRLWEDHIAIVSHQWCNMQPNSWDEVIPETVGQFTGLQDKNGVDIYEGDILKNARGDWGVIVSKDHCFEVTVSETKSSLYTKEYFNTSEVIGNIHENPELLNN